MFISESSLKCQSKLTWGNNDTKTCSSLSSRGGNSIPRAHECHHRHRSPTANLGQKTIAIVFCPRLAVAHLQFIEDLRSHLGKSSRKYRWPRRKCLKEICKRNKGKQKVIRPRSNVLQQLFWTIYLTWLSLDELVITLRSGFLSLKFYIFFQPQEYSLWTSYPRGTLVSSLQ